MTIREAQGDPWLFSGAAYEIYGQCMYRPSFDAYREEMTALSGDPDCRVFVCSREGDNVGIIALKREEGGGAEIVGVAVAKEWQRRGIGRYMVQAAAVGLDADRVRAETDGEAVGFYGCIGFSTAPFTRHFPDGDAARFRCELDMSALPGFEIRPTGPSDLEDVRSLWAEGEVMKFVGFPEGLRQSKAEMEDWFRRIQARRPRTEHFSVFFRGVYCGESFYSIDGDSGVSELDIKLFPFARGKGIATRALRHAIRQAFAHGAVKCYVDPNPENARALALYRRIGMAQKEMPEELRDEDCPGFLYFEIERGAPV